MSFFFGGLSALGRRDKQRNLAHETRIGRLWPSSGAASTMAITKGFSQAMSSLEKFCSTWPVTRSLSPGWPMPSAPGDSQAPAPR